MTTDPGRSSETGAVLARGIALIVVAGAALGVGFNALQHSAGSERALAWIGREIELDSFEDLHGDSDAVEAATADPPPASSVDPANDAAPAQDSPPPAGGAEVPGTASRAADPGARDGATGRDAAAGRKSTTQPPPTAATPPSGGAAGGATAPRADLPAIPDTPEPLEVRYATVKQLHDAGAAVLVDARSREEYETGHIPGARHLSADAVFEDPSLASRLDTRGLPIITYCSSADCNLSRDLAFALIEGGHRKVLVYKAGVAGWEAEGLPLVPGAAPGGSLP